jgi:catechol 2,3-dioxygenase-like lactoylglutathione lyase family enzyme
MPRLPGDPLRNVSRYLWAMNKRIDGCSLHHVAVQTRDWDASLGFYRDLLGMRVIAEFGDEHRRLCLLETGGGGHIELYGPTASSPSMPAARPSDPFVHIALATNDTRASIEYVRSAGCEVTVEPLEFDAGALQVIIAFFRGPSGETIEFIQVLDDASSASS